MKVDRGSADYRVLDTLVKEKNSTWTKSGREIAKREADLDKMLEKAATDEKKEGRDRDKLGDKLEAKHNKKVLRRSKVFATLCENKYFESYDKGQGRARTLMTKCWQSNAEPRHKKF